MATATARGISMPSDPDAQVAYWVLGTIARHNGNAPQHGGAPITTGWILTWDDDDWQRIADDTPQIEGPVTAEQRERIRRDLFDLEREDLGQDDQWWER